LSAFFTANIVLFSRPEAVFNDVAVVADNGSVECHFYRRFTTHGPDSLSGSEVV
jgi:hypothetical protein